MCVDFIRKTSQSLQLPIKVTQMETLKFLSDVKMQFNFIFADPPYDLETQYYLEIIEKVFTNQLLDKYGLLIIEHSEKKEFKEHHRFVKSRKYGSIVFSFFEV